MESTLCHNVTDPWTPIVTTFSSFSSPIASHQLILSFSVPMVSNVPLKVLIDSGCTCSFIDQHLVSKIPCIILSIDPPVDLQLFDGSVAPNGPICSYVDLDFTLPGSFTDCFPFLVTQLDSSCSMALGYDWLFAHNPNIDWWTSQITLHNLSTTQIDIHAKCDLCDCCWESL